MPKRATDHGTFADLIGEKVFIRTVTMHYTGTVKTVSDTFIELRRAAWIADTGRFATALSTGVLSEVEPYPDGVSVWVSIGAVVDVSEWQHELPREQK